MTAASPARDRGPARRAAWRLAALLCVSIAPLPASAHEVRPAYLELREESPGAFRVLWKTPMRGELRLSLQPVFSGATELRGPVSTRRSGDAAVQTWQLAALEPLRGQSLRIAGLERTLTDALVRVEFGDGTSWLRRLTPTAPSATIPLRPRGVEVAGAYLGLGVEHILSGIDHLLFVGALLMITGGGWLLVKTVTAFTLAHSLTLSLSTLDLVRVPAAATEASIALSIAFVAAEIARRRARPGLTARAPWIVAFGFGLLHGFGFAGALLEAGLPEAHVPLALLFFNLGVEAGQLAFIAAALGLVALAARAHLSIPRSLEVAAPYAIGSVAMFWVIERIAEF